MMSGGYEDTHSQFPFKDSLFMQQQVYIYVINCIHWVLVIHHPTKILQLS